MLDTFSMAKQLKGEYREVFEKVDTYRMFEAENEEVMDERLMDLYDLLVEAQQDGVSVKKIVGEDIEVFCKNFFDKEKKEKWFIEIWKNIYDLMIVVLLFTVVDVVFLREMGNIQSVQSNITPFIGGLAAGLVFVAIVKYCLKPCIFRNKKIKPIHYAGMIIGIFLLLSMVGVAITSVDSAIKINSFPLFVVSLSYVTIYLLMRSIWRYKKFGRITKIDRQEKKIKKEFNEEVRGKSDEKIFAEMLTKRFERINSRKRKRGKPELSLAEFAEKIRSEEVMGNKVSAFLLTGIVLVPSVIIVVNDGIFDGLLFAGITGAAEGAIYYFFFKSKMAIQAFKMKLQMIEACEQQGITMREYVKRMEEHEN